MIYYLLSIIIGYIFGALPMGFLLVKLMTGSDLRTIQSGRTGGTNAYRAAGLGAGIGTILLDGFKGLFPVLITQRLFDGALGAENVMWAAALAGIFAVIGHNWSVFLGFKGGAGTGPNVGWATGVWGPITPIALLMAVVLFYLVGMASVVSLSIAIMIPVVLGILYAMGLVPLPFVFAGVVTLAIVAFALRGNLKRVFEGNERIVGPRLKRMERKQANQ